VKSSYIKQNAKTFQEFSLLKVKSTEGRQVAAPITVKPPHNLKQNPHPCQFRHERPKINIALTQINKCQCERNFKTPEENSGKRLKTTFWLHANSTGETGRTEGGHHERFTWVYRGWVQDDHELASADSFGSNLKRAINAETEWHW